MAGFARSSVHLGTGAGSSVAACGCAPGRVTTSAIAAATTLGASSTPRLSRATSIAGADMTSPTVSSACAQVPVAAAAKLSAARTIKTTYHHAGAVLGVHQPEIGDQVGHAPRGRGRSEESRQQGTIMSPSFRSNRQPSGRLTDQRCYRFRNLGLDLWRLRFPRQRVQKRGT